MKQPARNTLRLYIRVDPHLLRKIKLAAAEDEKSDTQWIRDVLKRSIAARRKA